MSDPAWSRLTWATLLMALASALLLTAIGCVLPDTLHGHTPKARFVPAAHERAAAVASVLQSRPLDCEARAPAHVLRDRFRDVQLRHCRTSG